jgi:hypothetical protein
MLAETRVWIFREALADYGDHQMVNPKASTGAGEYLGTGIAGGELHALVKFPALQKTG